MDTLGNAEARVWVSAVKAMVPERCCAIIDEAMQMHGAAGISQWFPLAEMWHGQRTLRLADGPDEVHHQVVARAEVNARQAVRERSADRPGPRRGEVFSGP
jgi:acyl-CoA dehydrogenase